MIELLISLGADVNLLNRNMGTTLYAAVRINMNSMSLAKILLEHGANVDVPGEIGDTAFWWACKHNDLPTARLLIRHGANIHTAEVVFPETNITRTALQWLDIRSSGSTMRIALELYAKRETNWFRRKSFLLFLHVYETQPTLVKQLVTKKVLSVPELLRLITSFL